MNCCIQLWKKCLGFATENWCWHFYYFVWMVFFVSDYSATYVGTRTENFLKMKTEDKAMTEKLLLNHVCCCHRLWNDNILDTENYKRKASQLTSYGFSFCGFPN